MTSLLRMLLQLFWFLVTGLLLVRQSSRQMRPEFQFLRVTCNVLLKMWKSLAISEQITGRVERLLVRPWWKCWEIRAVKSSFWISVLTEIPVCVGLHYEWKKSDVFGLGLYGHNTTKMFSASPARSDC